MSNVFFPVVLMYSQVRSARQEAQMYLVTVLGTTRKRLVSIHRYSTTTVKQFWLKQFADHLNDLNQLQTMFQRIQQESVDKERRYKENMHEYETKVQELQLLHERSRATIDTLETDRSQLTQELTTFRSASTTEIQSIRTELQALAQEHNVLRNSYTAQNEVTLKVKEEVDVLNIRLRKQQETYTNEHDEWTKERLQLQRQAKSIQLLTDINVVPPLWRQTDKEMYRNNSDHDIFDNDDNSNNIVSFPSAGKRFRKSGTSDDSTLTKGRTLFAITLTPPVPSMDYHLPCTDTDSTLATFPPHRSLINHRAGSVNPSLGIQADKNWYQRLPMIKNTLEKLQSFTGSNENKWSFENNSENSE